MVKHMIHETTNVLWVGGLNKFDYAEMQILQVAYSTTILLTCPHDQIDLL